MDRNVYAGVHGGMYKEHVNTLDPAVKITRLRSVIRFLALFPHQTSSVCRPKTALECADRPVSPPVLLSATVITMNSAAACSELNLTGWSEQRRLRLVHFKAPVRHRSSSKAHFPPLRNLYCTNRLHRHRWNTQVLFFPPSANWWNCHNPSSVTSGIHSAQSTYLRSSRAWRGWTDCFCSQTVTKTLPLSVFEIWRLLALCRRPPLQGDSCGLSIKFT